MTSRVSLNAMRARRLAAWHEAKDLVEKAAREDRAFLTAAEQSQWNRLTDEMTALDAQVRQRLELSAKFAGGRLVADEAGSRRGYALRARSLTLEEMAP